MNYTGTGFCLSECLSIAYAYGTEETRGRAPQVGFSKVRCCLGDGSIAVNCGVLMVRCSIHSQ